LHWEGGKKAEREAYQTTNTTHTHARTVNTLTYTHTDTHFAIWGYRYLITY